MSDEQQDGMVYTVQGIERLEAEIDRLRAENEKLRAALKPFEKEADGCGYYDMKDCDEWQVPVSMIRAAVAALKETRDE